MPAGSAATILHRPVRILAISGSLRAASANAAVADAARLLASGDCTVEVYRGLGGLPIFNPDLESALPAPVAGLKVAIGSADALLISSPEYAHGVAGGMKNALDWLVSGSEMPGKPFALVNASQRATIADGQLRETLRTMSALEVPGASVVLPLHGTTLDGRSLAAHPVHGATLEGVIGALARHVRSGGRRDA